MDYKTDTWIDMLARCLRLEAPNEIERDEMGNRFNAVHNHTAFKKNINFFQALPESTRKWAEPEARRVIDAWKESHPEDTIPDLWDPAQQPEYQFVARGVLRLEKKLREKKLKSREAEWSYFFGESKK